jgi:hypothetical protein
MRPRTRPAPTGRASPEATKAGQGWRRSRTTKPGGRVLTWFAWFPPRLAFNFFVVDAVRRPRTAMQPRSNLTQGWSKAGVIPANGCALAHRLQACRRRLSGPPAGRGARPCRQSCHATLAPRSSGPLALPLALREISPCTGRADPSSAHCPARAGIPGYTTCASGRAKPGLRGDERDREAQIPLTGTCANASNAAFE